MNIAIDLIYYRNLDPDLLPWHLVYLSPLH